MTTVRGLLVALLALLLVSLAPAAVAGAQGPYDDGGPGAHDGWPPSDEDAHGDEPWPEEEPAPWEDEAPPAEPDPAADPEPDPFPPLLPDHEPAEPWDPAEPLLPEIVVPTTKTIAGKVALRRADGKAAIPRGAPKRVRQLIAAANQIVGKPYKWGGGHARLVDRGYDCSGAVSYALIRTRLLAAPRTSGGLTRWGAGGAGRWVTIYANRGHVYLEVAGLRLDTSPVADPGGRKGVRWRPAIGKRRGFSTRHPIGL